MMSKNNVKGKLAFITGSSRGVGRQIAIGLAQLGCNIIVHGRSEKNMGETMNILKDYPVEIHKVAGDLDDAAQLNRIISIILSEWGGIDILYNNAAIGSPYRDNIWDHQPEIWEKTFRINLFSMYYLCAAFIPGMIERGFGRIVNLTSGIKNQPELLPYSVSKAAVDKLTQDIAFRLKGTGVMINNLDPGWLKTDMGGKNAWYPVEDVLPGALAPVLSDDESTNGIFYSAIKLRDMTI